jgi:hypothetical protein
MSSSFSTEWMNTSGRYKFSYAKRNGYDTTEVRHNGQVNAVRMEGGLFGQIKSGEWKTKVYSLSTLVEAIPVPLYAKNRVSSVIKTNNGTRNVFVQGRFAQELHRHL